MSAPSVISRVWRGCGLSARMHTFFYKGDVHDGHYHVKDHITLVTQGGVLCEVEGLKPLEVWSPRIIPIPADKRHKFTALQDDTVYFCLFAGDDPGDARACEECNANSRSIPG